MRNIGILGVVIWVLSWSSTVTTQTTTPTSATYQWSAELVSLDAGARTATVRARLVGGAASDVTRFKPGDRVLLTWSGYDSYADAIRAVTSDSKSTQLSPFQMPAELVSTATPNDYVTFRVRIPEGSVARMQSVKPGQWVTATSSHHGSTDQAAITEIRPYAAATTTTAGLRFDTPITGLAFAGIAPADVSLLDRTYPWYGQLVTLDPVAHAATITAWIPPYVEQYVGDFRPGERLVLVWNMIGKSEATRVLGLWRPTSDMMTTGFALPITFVSADRALHTVTFSIYVPENVIPALRSMQAGQWIKVMTPIMPRSQDGIISSVESARQEPHNENRFQPVAVIRLPVLPWRGYA